MNPPSETIARVLNISKGKELLFIDLIENLLDFIGCITDTSLAGGGWCRDDVCELLLDNVTTEFDASFIILCSEGIQKPDNDV